MFWCTWKKEQNPFALVQERVAPVQNIVSLQRDTLRLEGAFLQLVERPLNPLLTALGYYEVSGPSSRHLGSQGKTD